MTDLGTQFDAPVSGGGGLRYIVWAYRPDNSIRPWIRKSRHALPEALSEQFMRRHPAPPGEYMVVVPEGRQPEEWLAQRPGPMAELMAAVEELLAWAEALEGYGEVAARVREAARKVKKETGYG